MVVALWWGAVVGGGAFSTRRARRRPPCCARHANPNPNPNPNNMAHGGVRHVARDDAAARVPPPIVGTIDTVSMAVTGVPRYSVRRTQSSAVPGSSCPVPPYSTCHINTAPVHAAAGQVRRPRDVLVSTAGYTPLPGAP